METEASHSRRPEASRRLRPCEHRRSAPWTEAQRAALEWWCKSERATLVVVCSDLGVSGGAPLDKRPGLLAAVDALVEHEAGVLLAMKRDRIARDVVAAGMIERIVEREGARVPAGTLAGGAPPGLRAIRTPADSGLAMAS